MTVTTPLQHIESGTAYHWAASGNMGADPDEDVGRLLTVAWVSGKTESYLSLIREMLYDQASKQLITRPVEEYVNLRNATFLENVGVGTLAAGSLKTLPVPTEAGGALDVIVSFPVHNWTEAQGKFGVNVRAPSSGIDAATAVTFSVGAPDANGDRSVDVMFPQGSAKNPAFQNVTGSGKVLKGEALDVRILVDRPLIEVFVQGGRIAAVSADTFNVSSTSVHVFNLDQTPIEGATASVYSMGCGWTDSIPSPIQALGQGIIV